MGAMSSQTAAAVPVIIGVGDVRNKSLRVEDATEPAQLMVDAVQCAINDTGLDGEARKALLDHADVLRVVPTWTWVYNDLPGVIAERLGVKPCRGVLGYHGGNQPALQCDEAARDIASRKSVVSIITGGEALASRRCLCAARLHCGSLVADLEGSKCQWPPVKRLGSVRQRDGWSRIPTGNRYHWILPYSHRVSDACSDKLYARDLDRRSSSQRHTGSGTLHSMGLPIHVYPLYENARRAHRRQSAAENNIESAKMYAAFDGISSINPYSWNFEATPKTAEQIGSPSQKNRIICDPCAS